MNGRALLPCLLLLSGLACGSPDPADPDGGSVPQPDSGGSSDPDSGTSPDPDSGTMPDPDSGTSPTGFRCTTGAIFSGHPLYDSEVGARANDGDPLAGVPGRPLLWRQVVFVGTHIVTVTGREVWASDLSAASPTLKRIAGREGGGQALLDGPCSEARFANLQDLVADSEGSLYVMDQTGNAILKITDPFGSSCTVHYWAGTSVDTTEITPDTPPNVGNTDGPGLSAQFALPRSLAIDGDDNLYAYDEGNGTIRKIANDASHTVSTLAPVQSGSSAVIMDAMVVLGNVLYVYAHDTAGEVFLQAIDVATGATSEILRGRADLFGLSGSLRAGGMTTDGIDLFVYFNGGIFRVTTGGEIEHVAGDVDVRSNIEFQPGYDPAVPHPAFELQLATVSQYTTAGAHSWLGMDENDDIYFVGHVDDPYVVRIECER
ncbi:MAG TPA: hypothetical protein VIL20_15985 [Sandaracinaceae bacterium]